MGPVTTLSLYLLIWWVIFIAILPFGSQSYYEAGIAPPEGCDPGAPINPNMKKKVIYTSLISLGVMVVFWLVVFFDLIPVPETFKVY